VDLAMASTFLRFQNADVFQILDRHAYRAVFGKRYSLYSTTPQHTKVSVYFRYFDSLIELAASRGLPFRALDRILYVFDKEHNGKLT
jgi:thermostable 8-oxoguanine DNA glycosylase